MSHVAGKKWSQGQILMIQQIHWDQALCWSPLAKNETFHGVQGMDFMWEGNDTLRSCLAKRLNCFAFGSDGNYKLLLQCNNATPSRDQIQFRERLLAELDDLLKSPTYFSWGFLARAWDSGVLRLPQLFIQKVLRPTKCREEKTRPAPVLPLWIGDASKTLYIYIYWCSLLHPIRDRITWTHQIRGQEELSTWLA